MIIIKKINRNSKVPMYQQLKTFLSIYIENELDIGDYIPTEKELIDIYNVSRITVRKAIDELVIAGILKKAQGRGTYVQNRKTTQNIFKINSWTEDMKLKNKNTKTINMNITKVKPSNKIKKDLNLGDDEKNFRIHRIRAVNNEPTIIMINCIGESSIPNFKGEDFTEESWYKFLEKNYDIIFEEATEIIQARDSTAVEAGLLNISEGDAILNMRRVSCVQGNIPVEIVEVIARGDKYQYSVKLKGEY